MMEQRSTTRFLSSLKMLFSRPAFVAGLAILGCYVGVALSAPYFYHGHDLSYMSPDNTYWATRCGLPSVPTLRLFPFSPGPYPLGQTIFMGYDIAQGLIVGSRWDLVIIGAITIPTAMIGLFVGLSAGTWGGKVDWALMSLTDTVLSIPDFVFVLLIVGLVVPRVPASDGPYVFILAMALVMWAPYARGVRGEAFRTSALPFVEASRASGASRFRVALRHVLPNSLNPVFAQVPVTVAMTIILIVGLQYIVAFSNWSDSGYTCGTVLWSAGTSAVVPYFNFPEWGAVLAAGIVAWTPVPGKVFGTAWWGLLIPALWICGFGLGVLLFCDGLRDWTSPRARIK
jgi:peptide/nickel transport system permease protein